ncbi:hypothetical protein FM113_03050 [Leucobacter sp. 7(1)]|nr:hypothetical protein FM113_03050 [Leucobacter sp. 7(1)]
MTGVCAGVVPAASALQGTLSAATAVPKTLVIGVDGATFDAMAGASMPNVQALQAGGLTAASNLPGNPMAPTVSGAGWSTIATGVWPDKHHVVNNDFTAPNYAQYPDYLTRIEATTPERTTAAIGTWGPISTTVFGPAVDLRERGAGDAATTARVVQELQKPETDDVFVHLDEVDGAGHSSGSSSAAYLAALTKADAQIGEMVAAVTSRPDAANEDWLILVTSDHGHTPRGGHGGSTKLERQTYVIAQGGGFVPGSVRHDVRISDIAPTVLAHTGIAADPAWDLDGQNVPDIMPDDFDTLRPQLRTAAQEAGPGQLLGWTDVAPEGWNADNSRMPTGGAPEFRGWTFMTDNFFSNVELGQHRENNVRSRDVFAIADSDEWADVNPRGGNLFDSTLVSPAYELNGAATADVSFVSDYAVDGPQGASVWVTFDEASGIPRQKLVDYQADGTRENPVNAVERQTIELPRGENGALPKTLSLQFSYSGNNSAFWVIDQVRFSQPEAPVAPATVSLSAPSVAAGGAVTVTGAGFASEERVTAELRSTPVSLGAITADATGGFAGELTIPADTAAGDHTLAIIRADGTEITHELTVTPVVDPGTDPGTTDPGTDPGTTDPGATDPGTTDPGTTDPGTTDPGTTDPGTTPNPGTQPTPGTGSASGTGADAGAKLAVTGGDAVPGLLVGGAVFAVLAGAGAFLVARLRRTARTAEEPGA